MALEARLATVRYRPSDSHGTRAVHHSGRKASLELRREPSSVEASRSKSDAIEGIDRTLEELKEKDPTRYDKNEKLARKWQARFVGTSS